MNNGEVEWAVYVRGLLGVLLQAAATKAPLTSSTAEPSANAHLPKWIGLLVSFFRPLCSFVPALFLSLSLSLCLLRPLSSDDQ